MAKDRYRANNIRDMLNKSSQMEGRVNRFVPPSSTHKKSYENYKNNMRVIKSNFNKLSDFEKIIVQKSLEKKEWERLYVKVKNIAKRVGGIYYPCFLFWGI